MSTSHPPQPSSHGASRSTLNRELSPATRRTYAADWALFTDWCLATDHQALPAEPRTVLEFLAENPAAPGTMARRVAALDHHHRACGAPPPGHDPSVARWLRVAAGKPAEPTNYRVTTEQLLTGLEHIPTHGWPAGVAGRRDRLLLLLSHAGLTRDQLRALQATDITLTDVGTTDARGLQIHQEGQDPLLLPPDSLSDAGLSATAVCPGCIWTAWARTLRILNRYWSIRPLREAFTKTTPIGPDTPHLCATGVPPDHAWKSWVFLATDQQGYLNPYEPLSTRSLAHRRTGAVHGTLRYRTVPAPKPGPVDDPAGHPEPPMPADAAVEGSEPAQRSTTELLAAHQNAMRQRHNDRAGLGPLDEIFKDLERRIEAWEQTASDTYFQCSQPNLD